MVSSQTLLNYPEKERVSKKRDVIPEHIEKEKMREIHFGSAHHRALL